jgi:hypothetical protein
VSTYANGGASAPSTPRIGCTGYTHCRACGLDVIDEILCGYCEEERVERGMPDVDELSQGQLDTLCAIAFDD